MNHLQVEIQNDVSTAKMEKVLKHNAYIKVFKHVELRVNIFEFVVVFMCQKFIQMNFLKKKSCSFSFQVEQIEKETALIDIRFDKPNDFLRFHKLKAATSIEMRIFMGLPDVDDTDEIDSDSNKQNFQNVGLRVSECFSVQKSNSTHRTCIICRLKNETMFPPWLTFPSIK